MILSLGLAISIGFTTLIAILLFLYIRHHLTSMENKVQSLLQVIQEEAVKNTITRQPNSSNIMNSFPENITVSETKKVSLEPSSLIEVSDNDDQSSCSDSESGSDSDSESGSDSDSGSESETKKVNLDNVDDEHIVNIAKADYGVEVDAVDMDTLDEVDVELDVEDGVEVEDNVLSLDDGTNDALDINYKKLSVIQLREMVEGKKLHDDPKKLKKKELLELLN